MLKYTRKIAYLYAFQAKELDETQKANEALSRRRRAKRKCIRHGGTLSVGEATTRDDILTADIITVSIESMDSHVFRQQFTKLLIAKDGHSVVARIFFDEAHCPSPYYLFCAPVVGAHYNFEASKMSSSTAEEQSSTPFDTFSLEE
ncbi:hypothetical protein V1509DRAFT_641656 [Lipomyces kononenkoae]